MSDSEGVNPLEALVRYFEFENRQFEKILENIQSIQESDTKFNAVRELRKQVDDMQAILDRMAERSDYIKEQIRLLDHDDS